jgi:hypothetical protein
VSQFGSTTTIEGEGPGGRPSRWVPAPSVPGRPTALPAATATLVATPLTPLVATPAVAPSTTVPLGRRAGGSHAGPGASHTDAGTFEASAPVDLAVPSGDLHEQAVASPWDHTDPQVWFRALLVPGLLLLAVVVVALVAITS